MLKLLKDTFGVAWTVISLVGIVLLAAIVGAIEAVASIFILIRLLWRKGE